MQSERLTAGFRFDGSTSLIDLRGDIDAFADADLAAAYETAFKADTSYLVLNFSNVGYINSTGIALIVRLLARARREGRRVAAFGLSDHYTDVFRLTRLSDFLTVYRDEAAALAATRA